MKCNIIFPSPVVLAALTVAMLLYSGLIPVRDRQRFSSLIDEDSIRFLQGEIISNPTKTSSGFYYSMKFLVFEVSTSPIPQKGCTSQSSGSIILLVPSTTVESLYPGKLFSQSKEAKGYIFETGAILSVEVAALEKNDRFASKPGEKSFFKSKKIIDFCWKNILSAIRARFRLAFKKILFSWGEAGALLLALLSGSREYTSTSLSSWFRNAGLSHILALSGMHLSLFAGIAKNIGHLIGGKRASNFLSPVLVLLFVWFAGLSPSLFRALLCIYLTMLIRFCFLRPRFLSILSLSFLLQICIYPMDIYSPAFMLSYGALLGIILGEKIVSRFIFRFIPSLVASSLTASIGAQLSTTPVTISLFSTCMPVGIIASPLVAPLASLFLVFGLCCIVVGMILPILMEPLGFLVNIFYKMLIIVVELFSRVPPVQF